MSEQTVFHDLSNTLTESERIELLKKIRDSLNMQSDNEDSVFHKEISQEERETLARHEMQMVSTFRRFLIWLFSRFFSRKKTDIFLQYRLKNIKKLIKHKMPGITGFETRDLSPKFAYALYDIYTHIVPVRKIFRNLWAKQDMFESVIITLIEEAIGDPVRELTGLISLDEMERVFAQDGTKTAIRNEVIQRITGYVSSIPGSVFTNLERKIIPLYNLKEIVLFPYHSFFDLFHYTPNSNNPEAKPYFRSASALLCLDFLEKLYYANYAVFKIENSPQIESELVYTLNQEYFRDREEPDDEELTGKSGYESEVDKKRFSQEVGTIIRLCKHFHEKMPIAEVLKYFKKDPYFKLVFYMPQIDLEAFYISVLKIRFLSGIGAYYNKVQELYIEKRIKDLFASHRLQHFQFYRIYSSIDYEKIGLPFFNHTRSLSLLYNYIIIFYKGFMQEVVQILDRGVLAQNRITRGSLLQHAATLEDVADRIVQFDLSLSSDHEDGKLFQRLRFTLASDTTHQKMYRTLVAQKDKQVQELIERGESGLSGLKKIFDELVASNAETVRIQIRSHYLINGKSSSLEKTLRTWSNHISAFLKLYAQVLHLEKG